VVYFAKVPRPGLVKTRLCPPLTPAEAAALYGAFLSELLVPVPGARSLVYGWPASELEGLSGFLGPGLELRPQEGDDLWQRMERCFDQLLREGHGPVLIRNTDSPDLPLERIEEALAQARPGRVVLGPDRGGGYYLVALGAPCGALFTGLEEGTATVFEETRRRAEQLGLETVILPVESDVDRYEDLLALWRARGESAPGRESR
jgi:rSAM/selenodomain-associated transferase 1